MKKASISIETIVIIILALIVLVIMAAAFSGGMAELWKKIVGVQQTATFTNEDLARQSCNVACTLNQKDTFCRTIKIEGVGDRTCTQLRGACEGISC